MSALSPRERSVAAAIFNYLVTPTGTKIVHTAADLAAYVSLPEDEIRRVLERLARGDLRLIRPGPPASGQERDTRFEIFHDVLADAILDWRARYLRYRELTDAMRTALETYVYVTLGLILLGFFIYFTVNTVKHWWCWWLIGVVLTMCALGMWIAAGHPVRRRWRRKSS